MKILEANAGALTNYEVVDFLRSKGAANDSTRVLAQVSPSEYKVYDYLVQTAACNQTREHINDFVDKCKIYGLAKAEVLNIINIRPTSIIDIYTLASFQNDNKDLGQSKRHSVFTPALLYDALLSRFSVNPREYGWYKMLTVTKVTDFWWTRSQR
ncbi:uncharacterized protein LOC112012384 isoform X2 [Quercus suber]|uniref:uncharacterized protein LOC112012384 isoform X2 n=1 Tax=Quercus suber TaxID=58331 RepID=UPI0032DFCF83